MVKRIALLFIGILLVCESAFAADIYCDIVNGDDGTGDGSSGTPYATLQICIDNANGGDTIYIADTGTETLTTIIDWVSFGGTTATSQENNLVIRSWNVDGTVTCSVPGGNVPCAHIDGNDAVASIFSPTSKPVHVTLYRLKMEATTSYIVDAQQDWTFYQCDISDGSGASLIDGNNNLALINSYLHDTGGSSVDCVEVANDSIYKNNFFENCTGSAIGAVGANVFIDGNIVYATGEHGIWVQGADTWVYGNSIIDDGTNANYDGVHQSHTNHDGDYVINNIIEGFSSTGAYAFGADSGDQTTPKIFGNNAFYNNTAKIESPWDPEKGLDITAEDQDESSSPFTDASGFDFSIVDAALSKGTGDMQGFMGGSSDTNNDIGAVQVVGGGSAGTNANQAVGIGY